MNYFTPHNLSTIINNNNNIIDNNDNNNNHPDLENGVSNAHTHTHTELGFLVARAPNSTDFHYA